MRLKYIGLSAIGFAAGVLGLSASEARATSVPVANFSFETPALANNTYQGDGNPGDGSFPNPSNAVPGWTIDGGGIDGVQNFNGTPVTVADGSQALYINSNYAFQDVGALLANTTYKLTVAVGDQAYGFGAPGAIVLLNGTNNSGAVLNYTPVTGPLDSFSDYSVSFTTGNSVSGDLTIELVKISGNQVLFDNVRLTAVPEPASLGLLSLGGLGLLARRRNA